MSRRPHRTVTGVRIALVAVMLAVALPAGTAVAAADGGTGAADEVECSVNVVSNGDVTLRRSANADPGEYLTEIEYQGRDITRNLAPYVKPDAVENVDYEFSSNSVRKHTVDGRAACTVRTVFDVETTEGDSLRLVTEVQLRADAQYAVVRLTFVNTGSESTTLRLPGYFIEPGFRLGTAELADKSDANGQYRFETGGTVAVFNETPYWSTFSTEGTPNHVTAYNDRDGLTVGILGGSTDAVDTMTEDGNNPNENSDLLTVNVGQYDLAPGESGSWTIAYVPHDGGEDAPDTGERLLDGITYDFGSDGCDVDVEAPPVVADDGDRPTDPNCDGRFEDVDGDGEFDIFDVVAFFENFDGDTVQSNAAKFDFDGDSEVDIFDVVELFKQVSAPS